MYVFKIAPVRGTKENEDWSYEKMRCVDLQLVNDISEGLTVFVLKTD